MKQAGISLAEAKFAAGDFSSVLQYFVVSYIYIYIYIYMELLIDILLCTMWTRLRAKLEIRKTM